MILQNKKFIGHRIKLIGKHPQAGKVGVYTGNRQEVESLHDPEYPVIKLEEGGEEVLVKKDKHWQLA
jgi:hypothetical protein